MTTPYDLADLHQHPQSHARDVCCGERMAPIGLDITPAVPGFETCAGGRVTIAELRWCPYCGTSRRFALKHDCAGVAGAAHPDISLN